MNIDIFKRQYEELKLKYTVPNLITKHTKVIFVLESPHVDELINQSPVSGLSGIAMSKVIFNNEDKVPFGIKIKSDIQNNIKQHFGIMNICSIPMQRIAYQQKDVVNSYGEFNEEDYYNFFNVIEKLRTNTKPKYKDEVKQELQSIILNDFRSKLEGLLDKDITFIPCGRTAETFFHIAEIKSNKWTVLEGVPHPSFGNWYKDKYKDKVSLIKELV